MKIKLRYVVEDEDRHGNVRLYFRRPGERKVRLRGPIGSPEFLEDYKAASGGTLRTATAPTLPVAKGTLRWACIAYFQSASFKLLDGTTQRVRRGILERLCEKEGDKPFAKMRPVHIRRRRDSMIDKPEAANGMVKALRQLYKFAVQDELVDHNYAAEVEYLAGSSDGFHAWTLDEVEKFEAAHPIGTKARLAFALLLYTGQRREDVRLFGRQHVRDGWLVFRQNKNRKSKPVDLDIPIVAELQRIIDATPTGDLTFVTSEHGRPYSSGTSFYNRFKKWCREAGIGHCAVHGLRKAAASRLAELKCTEQEIMSITGHRTSKEVARYTRAARQKIMAASAMEKLSAAHAGNKSVPPKSEVLESGTLRPIKHLKVMEK